jgi:hypothetical protein
MSRRQITAAWTLFFMVLTSVLVGMSTDSLAIGFALASGFMTIAGIMELYQ